MKCNFEICLQLLKNKIRALLNYTFFTMFSIFLLSHYINYIIFKFKLYLKSFEMIKPFRNQVLRNYQSILALTGCTFFGSRKGGRVSTAKGATIDPKIDQ